MLHTVVKSKISLMQIFSYSLSPKEANMGKIVRPPRESRPLFAIGASYSLLSMELQRKMLASLSFEFKRKLQLSDLLLHRTILARKIRLCVNKAIVAINGPT